MLNSTLIIKTRFTHEEDIRIQDYVNEFGMKWTLIANKMKTRTHRQIRERYVNYLNPQLQSAKWSLDEEKKIIHILSTRNNISWKSLEKDFPGRTDVSIKNKSKTKRIKKRIPGNLTKKESKNI
jgi:myb proto-oncogene protein